MIAVDPGTEHEALFPIAYSWLMVGRMCAGIDEYHRLIVKDARVSRDHLEIRVDADDGQAWAVDLSKNGTVLNAGTMTPKEPVPLRSGDLLRVGSSTLQFRSARVQP